MGQLGLERLGVEEPDLGALLGPALGEHERAAVLEREAKGGRLRLLRAGLVEAQPPGAHQMDVEDELAVLGREEEVLAAAAGARQRPAVERVERGVERLQRGDVRRAGLRNGRGSDALVERASKGLDLGKLGHRFRLVDAISVSVRRGDIVESRHRVHAVLVRAGAVEEAWGDPGLVTHMRSAAKPLQALGVATAAACDGARLPVRSPARRLPPARHE